MLWAVLFTAASIGVLALPAGAELAAPGLLNPIVLSYDFSNNSASPGVGSGPFNITVDILPEHTAGVVKITAVAPDGSASIPLVCAFQLVQQSQVQCFFNFTTNGLWSIRAIFAPDAKSTSQVVAVTVLRVGS
jgi:hypothetical protein